LADHLINFLLDLAAALIAAWLFLKYFSTLSDYWARRSTVSVRKKVARLEHLLDKYESDFSDSRTFMARLTVRAALATVIIITTITCIVGLVVGNAVYVYTVECRVLNTCSAEQFHIFTSGDNRQFGFIGLVGVWFFVTFLLGRLLMLEASPNKYRARFRERIAGLRSRLPEEAPDRPPSVNP
jgi:hypothetical protein